MDEVGLLGFSVVDLPLVVTGAWNQATAVFPGSPKCGFGTRCLQPGIDGRVADLGVLRPVRYQAPAHGYRLPAIIARDDCPAGLRWRAVPGRPGIIGRCRDRKRQRKPSDFRSEEPTSELQSLMRISYAVLC